MTVVATPERSFTVYAWHEGRRIRGRTFTCRQLAESEARRIAAMRDLEVEIEATPGPVKMEGE